jgi:hypothetical protein
MLISPYSRFHFPNTTREDSDTLCRTRLRESKKSCIVIERICCVFINLIFSGPSSNNNKMLF